jgi:hypothetical protein
VFGERFWKKEVCTAYLAFGELSGKGCGLTSMYATPNEFAELSFAIKSSPNEFGLAKYRHSLTELTAGFDIRFSVIAGFAHPVFGSG